MSAIGQEWILEFEVPAGHSISGNAMWVKSKDRPVNEASALDMLQKARNVPGNWRYRVVKVTREVVAQS